MQVSTPAQIAGVVATIPMGRVGSSEDCVGTFLYLWGFLADRSRISQAHIRLTHANSRSPHERGDMREAKSRISQTLIRATMPPHHARCFLKNAIVRSQASLAAASL